jgi:transitional endoplasmic reticulum ATPase
MPEDFRPRLRSFEFAGARITMIDPETLLDAAGDVAQVILHPPEPGTPAGDLSATMLRRRTDGDTVVLRGRIGPARTARPQPAAVSEAVTAVNEVVNQAGEAVSRLLSRLGIPETATSPSRPAREPEFPAEEVPSVTVTDEATGLKAAVRRSGASVLLESTLPGRTAGTEHIQAFIRILLDVARGAADAGGDDLYFAGQELRVSRFAGDLTGAGGRPGVRLSHLAGLDDVVARLREVVDSFNHPEVMAKWGARRPQGILMWGPPGTGKTTLAQALATEINGTLREIRTPEILSKWVGDSEKKVKRIFAEARAYREPTVLFFDEFDAVISYIGRPDNSADQMHNSIAGIFKQEMNTLVEDNPKVIVVATTNFPERVDDSLTRSGRFDVKLSVPLPDRQGRADILTLMLRRLASLHEREDFRLFAPDVDVDELAILGSGMSGADLRELLRRVQLGKAMEEVHSAGTPPAAIGQEDLRRGIAEMQRRS